MTKDLYLDIDVVRDASGELRANVDFSRYVGHVQEELAKKIDAAVLDSLEPQLNALGWVKERTCHNIGEKDTGWFKCSKCGAELHADCIDGFNPDIYVWVNVGYADVHYCPYCGRKVVKE